MTKILFLLPPSEGKKIGELGGSETLSFYFQKPKKIAKNATEKDLKCTGKRYEEGITLNKNCGNGKFENYINAIHRYSGVMYNAIGYDSLSDIGRAFFDDHFLILSGMYGLVMPEDIIGNYKLPIETKGLLDFWGDKVTKQIQVLKPDYIVNLLPLSYGKMINFKILDSEIIHVNFFTEKNGESKKMTHGVKKVKGEWIRKICEQAIEDYNDFGGEIICNLKGTEISITV